MIQIPKIKSEDGRLYEIKRIYKIGKYTSEDELKERKDKFFHDAIIRDQHHYYLCDEIKDAYYEDIEPEMDEEPKKIEKT